jgi:hypothetical protein
MEKRFRLSKFGRQLWTREFAKTIRSELNQLLENSNAGDTIVIDSTNVEVFDFSFANELFGKSILSLQNEYPDRFLIIENLSEYARENLDKGLESLGIAMIERKGDTVEIVGKLNSAYKETFFRIASERSPVTAVSIKDAMKINLAAANERLSKLLGLGLIRRQRSVSDAGREQFIYSTVSVSAG